MHYIHRLIEKKILEASHAFSALLVTGPRRAGKTTLLRKLFPKASYYLLEDPDVIARVKSDPRSFLEEIKPPAILDEIQNTPELFNYLRTLIDKEPRRLGKWFLTGSQDAPLMKGVSESMAGRIAVFHLSGFSLEESKKVSMLRGGFPEVLARPRASNIWFRSYIQTYLERDVRSISAIKDLALFRRFLSLIASRQGALLNKTDLAAPLGLSVPALTEWINILEITGAIIVVPPFYENFGKRLIKSPKIYFMDSGLSCYLLGIETENALRKSAFLGQVFEGFVASEIVKHQENSGRRRQIYYFRDQQGLEVDFVVPTGNARLLIMEAKAVRSVRPSMGAPLLKLARAIRRYKVEKRVVYLNPPEGAGKGFYTLIPGVTAVPVAEISSIC
ncbi:MAG: ATP-binding protein [Candidatus Omnitrophica bacterium]|nr:ATP-binding protein [Candidatus Omnitrophota bacterium]